MLGGEWAEDVIEVGQERAGLLLPLGGDGDPTATVVGVRGVLGVLAAGEHVVPAVVTRMVGEPVRSVVQHAGCLSGAREPLAHRAAPPRAATGPNWVLGPADVLDQDRRGHAAVALAGGPSPGGLSGLADRGQLDHEQPPEPVTDLGIVLPLHRRIVARRDYTCASLQ